MNNNPLITIIIPCYNEENHIGNAIESALSQTYGNIETIVVDDGSNDNSLKIIHSFGNRIRCFTGPNRGGAAARNRGIKMAKGELIQFLDADDLLSPKKIETQVKAALKYKPFLVYCDEETIVMESGEKIRIHSPEIDENAPMKGLLQWGLSIESILHWKEELNKIAGFREDLPCAQEFDLHLRFAANGMTFYHLAEILFVVQKRKDSVSSDYIRVLDQMESIIVAIWKDLKSKNSLTETHSKLLAETIHLSAERYMDLNEIVKAHHYYQLAREIHEKGGITRLRLPRRIICSIFGPFAARKISRLVHSFK